VAVAPGVGVNALTSIAPMLCAMNVWREGEN
jgi:hypothetical protein